jgi:hypothetical protein
VSYPVTLGAIVLTSANNVIRITENATTASATIATGTYYLRGDGAAGDLLPALVTALQNATASANTYTATVAWSIDPATPGAKITITRATGADNFAILWADIATTFDEALSGFSANTALDALAKTSTKSCAATWVCNDVAREIEPYSERVVAVPRAVSGRVQGVTRSARMESWRLGLAFVDQRRVYVQKALAGPQDTLEGFMERFGAGASMELHEAQVSSGTTLAALSSSTLVDVVHFSEETLSRFEPTRLGPGVPLYSIDLRLQAKV